MKILSLHDILTSIAKTQRRKRNRLRLLFRLL